jgi:trimeric autotransporter adhesin
VLRKVVALPITEWNYKTLQGARHLGPVAQDFRAAFGLGTDDKGISTVDADGVALAAIQGLHRQVEAGDRRAEDRLRQLENENAELRRQNQSLTERLAAIERRLGLASPTDQR